MQRLSTILIGFLILGSVFATISFAQRETSVESQLAQLERFEIFDGTIEVGAEKIRVTIRNWGIHSGQDISEFPQEGFLIVQLRAGSLITAIDGERQERQEGEFWIVPAGSSMAIETGDDAAVVQVTDAKEIRVTDKQRARRIRQRNPG